MANKITTLGVVALMTLTGATITTPAWAVSSEQVKKEYQQFSNCLAKEFAEKNKTEQPETPYEVRIIDDGGYGPEIFIFGKRTDGVLKGSRDTTQIIVRYGTMILNNYVLREDGSVDTSDEVNADEDKINKSSLDMLKRVTPDQGYIVEKCSFGIFPRKPSP